MLIPLLLATVIPPAEDRPFSVTQDAHRIHIAGPALEASIRKDGYVSGVEGGSLLDVKTGARDLGFGLDIVDWLMEPGSDEAYRDRLPGDLPYSFNNLVHGNIAKRYVEGPQICTQAKKLPATVSVGDGFTAIRLKHQWGVAYPPREKAGSVWEQTLIFPGGERFFLRPTG